MQDQDLVRAVLYFYEDESVNNDVDDVTLVSGILKSCLASSVLCFEFTGSVRSLKLLFHFGARKLLFKRGSRSMSRINWEVNICCRC